jgi:hypothetical protein
MINKLKILPENVEKYGFYAVLRDPKEIALLREVSKDLGWPSNQTLVHLLAKAYATNNLERMQ